MGTITGQEIVNQARRILQDTTAGGTRWLDAEMLDWINNAQRMTVLLKPNAYSAVEDLTLVAGTKQSLPALGLTLMSIMRNTNGRVVRRVDRGIMDTESPDWHAATASPTVLHYVFDEDAPRTFWVYPPQPSSGQGTVEIIYSKSPADLAVLSDPITLNDIYSDVILDYVLYRAYSKDADTSGNLQRAANHYQAFTSALGARTQLDAVVSPNADPQIFRGVG